MNAIEKLVAEYEKAKAELQTKMKDGFKVLFKQFFEENPEVTFVGWNQYTPYFNDGEACVFGCNAGYAFATNASDCSEIKYGEYSGEDENVWICDPDYGDYNEEKIPETVEENMKALRSTLGKIPDEIYLELFGDHSSVYASKDGFDVEDYEHD